MIGSAMLIPLIITIAACVAILAVLAAGAYFGQRALATAGRGEAPFGRWRFSPNGLGIVVLLLLPVAALLLWRVFPLMFFLPVVIPLIWRLRGASFFNRRRRREPDETEDDTIEGRYRPLDDQ
jgi:hypothetical protein